jgi:hypothetical protein
LDSQECGKIHLKGRQQIQIIKTLESRCCGFSDKDIVSGDPVKVFQSVLQDNESADII